MIAIWDQIPHVAFPSLKLREFVLRVNIHTASIVTEDQLSGRLAVSVADQRSG